MRIPVIEPGVKIGTHVASGASDEYLLFLAQLGIRHVRVHFQPGADGSSHVMHTVDRFGAAGLSIFSVVHLGYQAPEVARGLPGRDKVIGGLVDFIHLMGRLGLHTLEFDFFLYAPLPATGQAVTRGAASREFDLAVARRLPDAFDQCYGEDEMWDSFTYMMRSLLPAAEAAGVRLALHPDDPPVPSLLGVARIFRGMDSFQRAFELFDSPAFGALFCVGTWAEGGQAMGVDICEALRLFASQKKLFTVHFRNVTAPLPRFTETFIDNGYVDMVTVMRTLSDVGFDGIVIPDHFPSLIGDSESRAALANGIGYMRGLLDAVRPCAATK